MVSTTSSIPRQRRFRTEVLIAVVVFATIVADVVLVLQPSGSSQNATGNNLPAHAAPAPSAPVPTVLPSASPPTTLIPATAAEQAAFKAGQLSCQTPDAITPVPAGAAEQAAFKAGEQWCHTSTTAGDPATPNK